MDIRELAREDFPAPLGELPEPPERLWLSGQVAPPGHKHLVVVGSRALTSYGREATNMLIRGLAGYPISIVSGLALGADAAAHKAALAAGLHTLAVPGSGLDDRVLYPASNIGIARDIIASGGALLSEHPPDYRARAHDFPSRNRIMVGLADAVLVIEAAPRSGTLITARLASEYSRDLLCIPHRIGDPHGFAAHLFLRLGAALISEPLHILEALGIAAHETGEQAAIALEGDEHILYDLLAQPRARDELLRLSPFPSGQTLTTLVTLELRGLAKEEFGLWRRS